MINKNKSFVCICFILVLSVTLISGFQGSSDSYSSDNRVDSFSDGNASSSSFTQRLIGGIQTVGEYVTDSFSGRFGILSTTKNLVINITSHNNGVEVIRGKDSVAGEDDKGYINDTFNFTAQVFESGTTTGFSGASCYFYDDDVLFGTSDTNSSGQCTINFTKIPFSESIRTIVVNYSVSTSDTIDIATSEVNISLVRYVTTLTMGNLRTRGCSTGVSSCYHSGDNVSLTINITKFNETGSVMYDPVNISANATNAAETLYANGDSYYPEGERSITRTALGMFNTSVVANNSFGAQIRWDVLVSDNNYSDFISTAVHADAAICAADFGGWSGWSDCSSGSQTSSRTDSTSCTEVRIQSCTDDDDDDDEVGRCIPVKWSDWSEWGECNDDDEEIRTRSNGCKVERDVRDCGCVPLIACDDWSQCTPDFGELDFEESIDNVVSGGIQTKTCRDLKKCESDESWEESNECIISGGSGFIEFTPANRNLEIANNTRLNFEGKVKQNPNDVISINWYLNNEFRKGESLSGELTSSFSGVFSSDAVVKAELSINSEIQIEIWEIKINPNAIRNCEEKWSCDYDVCDGFSKYRIDDTCIDSNACGTNELFPDFRKPCDCVPDYECNDWEECNVDYDLTNILKGEPNLDGIQKRTCKEIVGCVDEKLRITQERECSLASPIKIEIVEWCFEDYIEIYDLETENLVSRVKERNVNNLKRVDIGFLATEFGGICSFCFDGIKNYDETGVDCGGTVCQECVDLGKYFDYLYYIRFLLWALLLTLTVYCAYRYKESLLSMPEEVALIRLRKPKPTRFKSRFRFRLPKIFRPKALKTKRIYIPELKPRRSYISEPYAGLRSKLREWKKKGYHETSYLEKNLANVIRESGHQHRLAKERRRIEKERLVHERKLAKFRKKAESERIRGRRKVNRKKLFAFFFSKRNEIKSKRLERKEQRRRLKREKRRLILEKRRQRRIRKAEIKRRNERQKAERVHERKLKENLRKVKRKKIGTIIKALFVSYQHGRARKKLSRHHEKVHKKQVKSEKKDRRKSIKRKKRLFKLKRREERKHRRKEKHRVRKEVKLIKKRIRKKQVPKAELSDLRRKLRDWQSKGYYSTTRLQKKLDKHEDKDPLS